MPSIRPTAAARRLGVLAAPAVAGAFILASCGGETATTQSTIDLSQASTAFVVRPPATTEPAVDVDGASVVAGTQEYVVQAGDYPLLLVERFGITLDDLIAVNEWGSVNEFPGPGTTILIPPGGASVDEAASAPAAGSDDGDAETDTAPSATIPDAGDNCGEGSYTITESDTTRIGVAEKFDVTVEALDAANANTPGYSAFFPGLEIVIPAKDDC